MISRITYINIVLVLLCGFFLFKTVQVWQKAPSPPRGNANVGDLRPLENPKGAGASQSIQKRLPPQSVFQDIASKNLFSAERSERELPEPESENIAVDEIPKVDGRQIQLFGVVMIGDYVSALIRDPSNQSPKGQSRWVKPGERIGQLRVDEITKESVMLSDPANKRFRVSLYASDKTRSSNIGSQPAKPTIVTTQPAPEVNVLKTPKATAPSQANPPAEKGYQIIKTPFGEIKRPIN